VSGGTFTRDGSVFTDKFVEAITKDSTTVGNVDTLTHNRPSASGAGVARGSFAEVIENVAHAGGVMDSMSSTVEGGSPTGFAPRELYNALGTTETVSQSFSYTHTARATDDSSGNDYFWLDAGGTNGDGDFKSKHTSTVNNLFGEMLSASYSPGGGQPDATLSDWRTAYDGLTARDKVKGTYTHETVAGVTTALTSVTNFKHREWTSGGSTRTYVSDGTLQDGETNESGHVTGTYLETAGGYFEEKGKYTLDHTPPPPGGGPYVTYTSESKTNYHTAAGELIIHSGTSVDTTGPFTHDYEATVTNVHVFLSGYTSTGDHHVDSATNYDTRTEDYTDTVRVGRVINHHNSSAKDTDHERRDWNWQRLYANLTTRVDAGTLVTDHVVDETDTGLRTVSKLGFEKVWDTPSMEWWIPIILGPPTIFGWVALAMSGQSDLKA